MSKPIWQDWLHLPHAVGADPRNGQAACCMVISQLVLEHYGFNPPDISGWIPWAEAKDWVRLQRGFDQHFSPTPSPSLGCVTLFRNGVHGLGVGTVVADEMLLFVHHKEGVVIKPIQSLRRRQYAKLKE